jgi:hypothetical protein
MADRRTGIDERKTAALAGAHGPPDERVPPLPAARPDRAISAREADPRRPPSKFGAAADGWDAYNTWLDRVRQPAPPSRQAVISKSLYSLSSYKNWADKARGAFDGTGNPGPAPGHGNGNKSK